MKKIQQKKKIIKEKAEKERKAKGLDIGECYYNYFPAAILHW